jgi:phosphatidylglycerophosphate synthase
MGIPRHRAALIPHALTGMRMLSAPLLWWFTINLRFEAAFACLAFAATSDVIDGISMRWIGEPSVAGGYFDATADCAVIIAAFVAFAAIGVYPAWTVGLIAVAFIAFLLTSRWLPVIYDPIGRHIGGILFVCIGTTLLLSDFFVYAIVLPVVTGSLLVTLTTRLAYTVIFVHGKEG